MPLTLRENAQRLTLLACCELISRAAGRRAQTHADAGACACARAGCRRSACWSMCCMRRERRGSGAPHAAYRGACAHRAEDERLSVAVECCQARRGRPDAQADALAACGATRIRMREHDAPRLCADEPAPLRRGRARLWLVSACLLPEDTVCQAYYAMARDEQPPEGRLTLGLGRAAAVRPSTATMRIVAAMAQTPLQDDARELCQLSAWALRSAIAGANTALLVAHADERAGIRRRRATCCWTR